jgi:hypothetical protein
MKGILEQVLYGVREKAAPRKQQADFFGLSAKFLHPGKVFGYGGGFHVLQGVAETEGANVGGGTFHCMGLSGDGGKIAMGDGYREE